MKNQLREGLKKLEAYVKKLDFQSAFLEANSIVPMDSLLIPLQIGEDLSIDITCNFVDMPDIGKLLQFYGQLMLNDMLAEAQKPVSDYDLMYLINELNALLPIGQFLYFPNITEGEQALGMRYTMLTELEQEQEFMKCANVLALLMRDYEILASGLLLLLDGEPVEAVVNTIKQLLEVS